MWTRAPATLTFQNLPVRGEDSGTQLQREGAAQICSLGDALCPQRCGHPCLGPCGSFCFFLTDCGGDSPVGLGPCRSRTLFHPGATPAQLLCPSDAPTPTVPSGEGQPSRCQGRAASWGHVATPPPAEPAAGRMPALYPRTQQEPWGGGWKILTPLTLPRAPGPGL